uniref:MFS aflatoxin efflux n=1 Tax=Colletotrichum fructicola (strain Nara gc5) TaxID=1213859 RepID=L2FXT1_COLFN
MLFKKRRKEEVAVGSPPVDQPASEPRTSNTNDDLKKEAQQEPTKDAAAKPAAPEVQYPMGVKLFLIMFSLLVSMFLVAMVRRPSDRHKHSILTEDTLGPPHHRHRDTPNHRRLFTDIGWYGSAYLLTSCAFQLLFGKLYAFFDIKTVFTITVVIFEVGSAICGSAPNSVAFIFGRAIAGVGGAGIGSGATMVMVHSVPLHRRPKYQGLFGAVFGVASIAGPLLGGAFTSSSATWRWCFWINLPLGVAALFVIFFILKAPGRGPAGGLPLKAKLKQLDFAGTAIVVPGTVCLLLALQWGGVEYDWNSARIIALLVLAGVFLITFIAIQILFPKTATAMMFTYYIPIWFQAIKGYSAVDSGIRTLPLVLTMMVFSVITGGIITRIGYYSPVMIAGNVLMCIGAGLLTTLRVNSGAAAWAGYQVIYGFGMGLIFPTVNIVAQTVLELKDISIGISIMMFMQTLGGAVSNSIGQSILSNELVSRLRGVPGLEGVDLRGDGATTVVNLPDDVRGAALEAYNESLRTVFIAGVSLCCAVIIGTAGVEWKSVKKEEQARKKAKEDAEAAKAAAGDVVPAAAPAPAVEEKVEGEKEVRKDGVREGEEGKR